MNPSRMKYTKFTTISSVGRDSSGKILQQIGTTIGDCPFLFADILAIQ